MQGDGDRCLLAARSQCCLDLTDRHFIERLRPGKHVPIPYIRRGLPTGAYIGI